MRFSLIKTIPNPFNPSTTIKFSIPKQSYVKLKIYDILGKKIAALVNEEKASGIYEANLNPANLSSGVYFYRLQAGNFVETKKMVLLR